MRRPASTSFSFVVGIVFLFLLLLLFVVIITNQFLTDFMRRQEPVSTPVLALSGLLIAVLAVILLINAARLVQDLRAGVPGIQYKARLVAFFVGITLVSSVPPLVLTANMLRNAFDVWFIRDTTQSLEYGVGMAVQLYEERSESLMGLARSELLPGLVRGVEADPERALRRLATLNPRVEVIQLFDAAGRALAQAGPADLLLPDGGADGLVSDQVNKSERSGVVALRAVVALGTDAAGAGTRRLVLASRLPPHFEEAAALLGATQRQLVEFVRLPVSFPVLVFGIYVLFFVPLLLIALMLGFYVADEAIRPLLQLEAAVNRVAQGDYSTRLLVRKGDAMGHFVASFNDMVGELERSRSDLKQSERLQTWQDIAQRMAHEIKNPLTPIRLSAERIQRRHRSGAEDFPRVLDEGVATIIQEVGAIANLLTEFRDFARLPRPVLDRVALGELVQSTWQLYEGSTRVVLDRSGLDERLELRLDRGQMLQVFKNLFQNALDAIEGGEGTIWVRSFVINRMGQQQARIQVQDTGSGIAPDRLREIFNPYYTTKQHGSGLGLAIVEKIVLDHGGRIWAESRTGEGTSFFIDLPLAAGRAPDPAGAA